ncbi:MAG: hypothetical protein LBF51_06450, partial [Zoogloeaceae bacterium]|nr:hypothetical protein [Zoogloeaceae bacterium]
QWSWTDSPEGLSLIGFGQDAVDADHAIAMRVKKEERGIQDELPLAGHGLAGSSTASLADGTNIERQLSADD